jgi:DNA-binding XRE family transcriptional regulator
MTTTKPSRRGQRWITTVDGQRLRERRRQRGLAQEELANLAGVGVTTVARLERQPQANCRTWTLARIAAALGEQFANLATSTATVSSVNGPLMAWTPQKRPRNDQAQYRDHPPGLGLRVRAGDENRTRTISLGMSVGHPLTSIVAGRRSLAMTVSIRQTLWPSDRSGTKRARDRLLRRSFHTQLWLALAQFGAHLGCSWLAAGDRYSPSVLARMWHAPFRRSTSLPDRLCWSLPPSGATVRPRLWQRERCQVRVDRYECGGGSRAFLTEGPA